MKKQTKLTLAALALLLLVGLLGGVYLLSRPDVAAGTKNITVDIVHADESTKSLRFQTDKEFWGELLLSENLVTGEQGPFGLYILSADGEVADYAVNKAYWALTVNGEYAVQGADATPIADGDAYRLVYTVG